MHISITRGDYTATQFRFVDISGEELYKHLCVYTWSPIIWRDGKRGKKNFLYSTALVLDFDDGKWTIDQACKWAESFRFKYVCGTTISHQKEKSGKPPCDRFRMLIPWSKNIDDLHSHEKNMRSILPVVPTDPACCDGARSYRPFKDIYRIVENGRALAPRFFEPEKQKPVYIRSSVPPWVSDLLQNGAAPGQRNATCFRIAANLVKCGLPENQIEEMIVSSNIDLPEGEKRNAARSGIRAGYRGITGRAGLSSTIADARR